MANLFTYFDVALPRLFTESVLKNIFKRGYEEIRDRTLLEILKKDRTWLKYELHCNVKTPAPLVFQNNLTFVIQMSSRESFLFEHFFCIYVVKVTIYIVFV